MCINQDMQWRIQDFPDEGANPWVWGKKIASVSV